MSNRVLFVAQHPAMWNSLDSVYNAFLQKGGVETVLLLANYLVGDKVSPLTSQLKALFDKKGYVYESEAFDLTTFDPQVVFLQTPYDSTRSKHLHVRSLANAGYRLCYVPYGLEMGGGEVNYNYQYNSALQNHAWLIFLRSHSQATMFKEYCDVGDSHTFVSGHPKFDATEDIAIDAQLIKKINQRKTILWTPHFAVREPATWSTYRLYGALICDHFKKNTDVFLIIRPHPKFFQIMRAEGLFDEASERQFRRWCIEADNVWLDIESNYLNAFSVSDALMADVGSFLLEYLPTRKPILYLRHPNGSPLNNDAGLVDHYYIANNGNDINDFIEMVSRNEDDMHEQRTKATNDYLYGLDGHAGQRIANKVLAHLTHEFDTHVNNGSSMQVDANLFWKRQPTSMFASPIVYELKPKFFMTFLAEINQLDKAIDIGCGEGKFTLPLAMKVTSVKAYDISPKLIHAANNAKNKFNIKNVEFIEKDYQEIDMGSDVDLISSNEFTQCILDESDFIQLMQNIHQALKLGGVFILVDRFSLNSNESQRKPSGRIVVSRNLDFALNSVISFGFKLISKHTIMEDAKSGITLKQFVFQK